MVNSIPFRLPYYDKFCELHDQGSEWDYLFSLLARHIRLAASFHSLYVVLLYAHPSQDVLAGRTNQRRMWGRWWIWTRIPLNSIHNIQNFKSLFQIRKKGLKTSTTWLDAARILIKKIHKRNLCWLAGAQERWQNHLKESEEFKRRATQMIIEKENELHCHARARDATSWDKVTSQDYCWINGWELSLAR